MLACDTRNSAEVQGRPFRARPRDQAKGLVDSAQALLVRCRQPEQIGQEVSGLSVCLGGTVKKLRNGSRRKTSGRRDLEREEIGLVLTAFLLSLHFLGGFAKKALIAGQAGQHAVVFVRDTLSIGDTSYAEYVGKHLRHF